jgi:hypothetical protein
MTEVPPKGKTRFKSVSRANPCPICERDHKCSVGEDGLILCGRTRGEVFGFVYLDQCKGDGQFAQYRREGDPLLRERDNFRNSHSDRPSNGHHSNGQAAKPSIDWQAKAEDLAKNLTSDLRAELADALGLPEVALTAIPLLGFDPYDQAGPCWTFPEVDGAGSIIGINRRYKDSDKRAMAGGSRGLTVPVGWQAREGPVLLVEGPSDVLAATAMGLPAIGRPSNRGGVEQLSDLLKDLPCEREVVVVGEYDPKLDGSWPGRDGAIETARKLTERLGRPIRWALPPDGAKDVRKWVLSHDPDPTCADAWNDLGSSLLKWFHDKRQDAPKSDSTAATAGYTFSAIDSHTFFTTSYELEWLVKRMLVRYQPAVVGGPKKALKTTTLMDLAISLATATPFLNHFKVYKRHRVLMISGESGEAVLQETGNRVCAARGVDPLALDVFWSFKLPQVASPLDRASLQEGLKSLGISVVILDPMYLCMLTGKDARDVEAGNLFHVGPLLSSICSACLDVGASPILCHHARKNLANSHEPMELEDLAFAGVQEFARQWILENRREPYQPGTGSHRLWLSTGGSVGHGGLWAVDVEEGVLGDDFQGRKWDVKVHTTREIHSQQAEVKEKDKAAKQAKKDLQDDGALLAALDRLDLKREGVSYTKTRDLAGLNGARAARAVARLVDGHIVEEFDGKVDGGSGAKRPARCLRRRPKATNEVD